MLTSRQVLAKNILAQLGDESKVTGHDASVSGRFVSRDPVLTPATDHWFDPLLPEEPKVNRSARNVSFVMRDIVNRIYNVVCDDDYARLWRLTTGGDAE